MKFLKYSMFLLTISSSYLLIAMEEGASALSATSIIQESSTAPKITKGQRRGLQRKRAKARKKEYVSPQEILTVKKSESEKFYDYFTSYLENPNIQKESFQFFRSHILFWAEKYNELGILDQVLNTYFEATKFTPNSFIINSFDQKKISLLRFTTESASYGYRPALVLFKKLLEHDGDPELIVNESNTLDFIKKRYKQLYNHEIIFWNDDKDKDQEHRERALKNTQEILQLLKQEHAEKEKEAN